MNAQSIIVDAMKFVVSAILKGAIALVFAAGIITAVLTCMLVFLMIPAYLIIECEYWIIGTIYTLFAWGIAWKIVE